MSTTTPSTNGKSPARAKKAPEIDPEGLPPGGEGEGLIADRTTATPVKIQPLKIARTIIAVRGVSPLIVHNWSEKAKRQMLEKQTSGKKASKKDLKVPQEDFESSRYLNADGLECIKTASFAKSLVTAARWTEMRMTEVRGVFFVVGELIPILTPDGKPAKGVMRDDMVRVFGGTADIRFRACYEQWCTNLLVEYNENALQLSQLFELVNLAGFSVGVAEWRPEKGGQYGRFEVDMVQTQKLGEKAEREQQARR